LVWGAVLIALGVLSIAIRPIILLARKTDSETVSIENLL
jgi:hypothetical protein